MKLNAPNKSLLVQLETVPTTPLTFIAEGTYTVNVDGIPTIVDDLNQPLAVGNTLPVELAVGDPDPERRVDIQRIHVLNPNNEEIKFWLIEKVDSDSFPYVGIKAAPGDNFYITPQGMQTLDACGQLKVINNECTVDDASFFTDYSFVV